MYGIPPSFLPQHIVRVIPSFIVSLEIIFEKRSSLFCVVEIVAFHTSCKTSWFTALARGQRVRQHDKYILMKCRWKHDFLLEKLPFKYIWLDFPTLRRLDSLARGSRNEFSTRIESSLRHEELLFWRHFSVLFNQHSHIIFRKRFNSPGDKTGEQHIEST